MHNLSQKSYSAASHFFKKWKNSMEVIQKIIGGNIYVAITRESKKTACKRN